MPPNYQTGYSYPQTGNAPPYCAAPPLLPPMPPMPPIPPLPGTSHQPLYGSQQMPSFPPGMPPPPPPHHFPPPHPLYPGSGYPPFYGSPAMPPPPPPLPLVMPPLQAPHSAAASYMNVSTSYVPPLSGPLPPPMLNQSGFVGPLPPPPPATIPPPPSPLSAVMSPFGPNKSAIYPGQNQMFGLPQVAPPPPLPPSPTAHMDSLGQFHSLASNSHMTNMGYNGLNRDSSHLPATSSTSGEHHQSNQITNNIHQNHNQQQQQQQQQHRIKQPYTNAINSQSQMRTSTLKTVNITDTQI
jgi:hypothetical protein